MNYPTYITFQDLNIDNALYNALEDLGLKHPTTIQQKAFSKIMSGIDIVGIAQTGTGKTIAFLLPLLRVTKYSKQIPPRVLILVPTRELVVQVTEVAEKLASYMNLRIKGVYGGTNMNTQRIMMQEGVDILVATPGRLYDLALSGDLKLSSIKHLVIDEVDEMLDLGFRTQLNNIIELLPPKRQNLMFSATLSEDIEKIISSHFSFPEKIEAAPQGTPIDKIIQIGYDVPNFNSKVNLLEHLLNTDDAMQKVLVFADSKKFADILYHRLVELYSDTKIGLIHSNKSQNFRLNALRQFQNGSVSVLIATDIVSRGLDIQDVSHVVNFDLPEDYTNYIHRIGRTGRADKTGIAISFIKNDEKSLVKSMENEMQQVIQIQPFPLEVEISVELIDEEKPVVREIALPGVNPLKQSEGAFHEKKAKNKKVNLGSGIKRKMKAKYKKPKTRGDKNKKRKKK
jgi:ATP-dependent RNA helicase RhlE